VKLFDRYNQPSLVNFVENSATNILY